MKLESKNIMGLLTGIKMGFSLPVQQEALACVDKRITEIREEVASGEKTKAEIATLLDELQSLSIDKHYVEVRIRQIKRAMKIREDRSEADTGGLIHKLKDTTLERLEEEPN